MLEWKAAEHGIRVEPVNPAVSSQTWSVCAHWSRTNRDSDGWFEGFECSYTVDGDYNVAKDIGFLLLTVPEDGRPSGLGDGQLALKSGTVIGNRSYIPSDVESADRESTGDSTTSVVGR